MLLPPFESVHFKRSGQSVQPGAKDAMPPWSLPRRICTRRARWALDRAGVHVDLEDLDGFVSVNVSVNVSVSVACEHFREQVFGRVAVGHVAGSHLGGRDDLRVGIDGDVPIVTV